MTEICVRPRILRLTMCLLAVCLIGAASSRLLAQAPSASPSLPFLGRWKLNAAKSDLQTTRLAFARAASGEITMTMQGMTQRFRIDGKEYPGVLGSTMIWSATGPRAWKTVYRLAKADNNIDYYTLSDDGKTLTMRTEIFQPRRSEQTMTFTRPSAGTDLIGTWQTKSLQSDDNWIEMKTAEGQRVQIDWTPMGGRAVAPVDGAEVPVTGPLTSVPPGMTAALKITGPRTFDMSMKMNGGNVATGSFTVAPDGKSMTVDSRMGPAQERSRSVYEKQ